MQESGKSLTTMSTVCENTLLGSAWTFATRSQWFGGWPTSVTEGERSSPFVDASIRVQGVLLLNTSSLPSTANTSAE